MTIDHFVVSQRDSVWQFSFRGDVTAPFADRKAAIDAAIAAAGKIAESEVVLRDGDVHSETIWRSGQADLSARESERLAADIERDRDA
ncbi:hypothetical protein ASD04_02830 [Devosia sp. Root436]|uniref:hypothetical protein n=1 Tax=Devosia sp. Root436 TaxID=1736537 RepID=UPI0007019011|nr:hypothetical protein [Devosia sp. Root436]KQX42906.1 hypothetical protein ASD04_02830 [Devosia sp. Root436]